MRFTRLHIKGYGCFSDREVHFREGLNLIYGPNETGKSTIQRFILAMLYGHKKPGLKRASYLDEQDTMLPWQGEAFGGTLEYVFRGVTYRVERDLRRDREEVRIFESTTGEELTREFPVDSRRENLFAEVHLGLNRTLFLQTTCVQQLGAGKETRQLGASEDNAWTGELAARLLNLQNAGDEETSVQRALSGLQARLDEIGSPKAPSKPYARAALRNKELSGRVGKLQIEREKLMKYEAALSAARTGIQALSTGTVGPVDILNSLGSVVLQGQWERAMELAKRLEKLTIELKKVQGYRKFPWEYRDELLQLIARAEELTGELPEAEQIRELKVWQQKLEAREGQINQGKTWWKGKLTRLLAAALVIGVSCAYLSIRFNPWFWIGGAGMWALLWLLAAFQDHDRKEKELHRLEEQIKWLKVSIRAAELLQLAGVPDLEAFLSGCRQRKAWEEYNGEKEQVREHLQSILESALSGLEERVEGFNRVGQELLETVRELEETEAELARMSREKAALELAAGCIREASQEIHRDFAPRLNERIGTLIAEITGGRYSQVRVDGSLNLRALSPETGRLVPLSALSSGTMDQFSLSLRLAVADLLNGGRGGLPLILDDSFGQWDDRRLSGVLAYLLELAQDNQILLFTCQQREQNILTGLGREAKDYSIINLGT